MKEVIYKHFTSGLKDFICDEIEGAIAIATKHCIPNMVENNLFINGKRAKIRMNYDKTAIITVKIPDKDVVYEYEGKCAFCETDGILYCFSGDRIGELFEEYKEHKVVAFGDVGVI